MTIPDDTGMVLTSFFTRWLLASRRIGWRSSDMPRDYAEYGVRQGRGTKRQPGEGEPQDDSDVAQTADWSAAPTSSCMASTA